MDFEAVDFEEGVNNMGGLRCIGYYGFIADVQSFPGVPSSPATLSDAVVITEDIVMKPGKTMYAIYGTAETGGLDGETQGERDSKSTKRTLKWFFPTTSKKALGFAKQTLNRRTFWIPREHDGKYRLIGSPSFPAEVSSNDTTGTAVTDRKGVTFTITDNGFGPCPIYEGTIPCDSGDNLSV